MFDLKYASIGFRKAAWLGGIRKGYYSPIHDHSDYYDDYDRKIGRVVSPTGKEIIIRRGHVEEANRLTWKEIR